MFSSFYSILGSFVKLQYLSFQQMNCHFFLARHAPKQLRTICVVHADKGEIYLMLLCIINKMNLRQEEEKNGMLPIFVIPDLMIWLKVIVGISILRNLLKTLTKSIASNYPSYSSKSSGSIAIAPSLSRECTTG